MGRASMWIPCVTLAALCRAVCRARAAVAAGAMDADSGGDGARLRSGHRQGVGASGHQPGGRRDPGRPVDSADGPPTRGALLGRGRPALAAAGCRRRSGEPGAVLRRPGLNGPARAACSVGLRSRTCCASLACVAPGRTRRRDRPSPHSRDRRSDACAPGHPAPGEGERGDAPRDRQRAGRPADRGAGSDLDQPTRPHLRGDGHSGREGTGSSSATQTDPRALGGHLGADGTRVSDLAHYGCTSREGCSRACSADTCAARATDFT